MQINFSHQGNKGHVSVSAEKVLAPAVLGARDGAVNLANCTATVKFAACGYLQLFGWVQLVRSTDNRFQGEKFEVDPLYPFGLYERALSPYCWYGIMPTLGFSSGFPVSDGGNLKLDPTGALTAADWESHIPYLQDCYPEWSFEEMAESTD
jgi:hypothetical protein